MSTKSKAPNRSRRTSVMALGACAAATLAMGGAWASVAAASTSSPGRPRAHTQAHAAALTVPPCDTPEVHVTPTTETVAGGTLIGRLVVENTSTSSCSMKGYPDQLDPYLGSKSLPIRVSPVTGYPGLDGPGKLIVLAPGKMAAFFVMWQDATGCEPSLLHDANGFTFQTPNPFSVTFERVAGGIGNVCGTVIHDSPIVAA